jgi:hypothetical protein
MMLARYRWTICYVAAWAAATVAVALRGVIFP